MNITVYLGALEGNDPMLAEAVRELGMWIGNRDVYKRQVQLRRLDVLQLKVSLILQCPLMKKLL